MHYEPTVESLSRHPVPDWFLDAKLGIFIHWGPASVPAWAPPGPSPFALAESDGWEAAFARTPYSEWYQNSLAIDRSPTQDHHRQHHPGKTYADFCAAFRRGTAGWDPAAWADLFARAGARYVVLITKHHDGFLLWPSRTPNPHLANWQSGRDLVGDLRDAVVERGMRFGVYYSGGIDWTFGGLPITDLGSFLAATPQSREYAAYADAHWRELIERYEPSVLWNDIGYPTAGRSEELIADYYNAIPDGVVNNRFDFLGTAAGTVHADFLTPEYDAVGDLGDRPWEACRGLGSSFGYNRAEPTDGLLAPSDLVGLLAGIVSGGGNLLLDVGPAGDGTVSMAQAERLLALGWWLSANGEAVYETRPHDVATGRTDAGIDVCYTRKGDDVFAIVLGTPQRELTLEGVTLPADSTVALLGNRSPVSWRAGGGGTRIELTERPAETPAVAFRLSPGSSAVEVSPQSGGSESSG